MKILYLSALASTKAIEEARKKDPTFSSYAVQKFNRLVAEGLVQNGQYVSVLSTFYQPQVGFFWRRHRENDNNVDYRYITSPNIGILRHIWVLVYCFFRTFFWGVTNKKNKVLICDVLNVSACTGAVYAARIIGLRRVGIMTDMPGLMVNRDKSQKKRKIEQRSISANKRYLGCFTHYVFLTDQMNEVNIHNRPYIVLEGLVSPQINHLTKIKTSPRTIFYAGGLHERYGLRMLINAVKMLPYNDIQLVLYGDGPIVDELKNEKDPRIVYKGLAPNAVIEDEEQRATLLVNPRPTHEEFTKYSFPSKNMEYMVSGTPLLTTCLPGMPIEYYPYVYLFEEETAEGYARRLNEILTLPAEDLLIKGNNARDFVLVNKNNIIQTSRILELLNK